MPYFVYILANARRTVLYTGVTRDLARRVGEHRSGAAGGFSSRYNATHLVHIETYDDVHDALAREKQIKAGSRARKEALICTANPEWHDLAPDLSPR